MDVLELCVTSGLCVLIWLIQLLHYPSFTFVDKERFIEFEVFHTQRITIIVLPLMLVELFLAVWNFRPFVLGLVFLIWASTFFLQVPYHQKLQKERSELIINRLISTNWIRTFLWTLKLFILLGNFLWPLG